MHAHCIVLTSVAKGQTETLAKPMEAKEVDEACLAELRKWVNLGALKIRNRCRQSEHHGLAMGYPYEEDARRVIGDQS